VIEALKTMHGNLEEDTVKKLLLLSLVILLENPSFGFSQTDRTRDDILESILFSNPGIKKWNFNNKAYYITVYGDHDRLIRLMYDGAHIFLVLSDRSSTPDYLMRVSFKHKFIIRYDALLPLAAQEPPSEFSGHEYNYVNTGYFDIQGCEAEHFRSRYMYYYSGQIEEIIRMDGNSQFYYLASIDFTLPDDGSTIDHINGMAFIIEDDGSDPIIITITEYDKLEEIKGLYRIAHLYGLK
jgi:hypothetical protein